MTVTKGASRRPKELITLSVAGMTCTACERRIAKALTALPGVVSASASARKRTASLITTDQASRASIEAAIIKLGYRLGGSPWLNRDPQVWRNAGVAAVFVAALVWAVGVGDITGRIGDLSTGGLLLVLALGLAAGVSTCMAMVGGIMATFAIGTSPALLALAGAPTLFEGTRKIAMLRALGVVVVDHALIRDGLSELLGSAEGIEVIGAIDDGAQAVAIITDLEPDIVLVDLSMPGLDSIEATREFLLVRPETKVIMLTSFSENSRILAALEVWAIGYLLKDTDPEDIIRALRDAADGRAPRSPRAARALLPSNRRDGDAGEHALSVREREVLLLVAIGLPNKSIARRLTISEKTVKSHLTRVFTVLGVGDRTSAALWAQRQGLSGRGSSENEHWST